MHILSHPNVTYIWILIRKYLLKHVPRVISVLNYLRMQTKTLIIIFYLTVSKSKRYLQNEKNYLVSRLSLVSDDKYPNHRISTKISTNYIYNAKSFYGNILITSC